jgi:hypothetical protein
MRCCVMLYYACITDISCLLRPAMLCLSPSDNTDLEAVLKETERQRREFAARYAFMTLDTDGDGYVSVEQVRRALLCTGTRPAQPLSMLAPQPADSTACLQAPHFSPCLSLETHCCLSLRRCVEATQQSASLTLCAPLPMSLQVLTYDLFSCYAPSVLMAAFSVWRWDSGFPGYLCMDDFVRWAGALAVKLGTHLNTATKAVDSSTATVLHCHNTTSDSCMRTHTHGASSRKPQHTADGGCSSDPRSLHLVCPVSLCCVGLWSMQRTAAPASPSASGSACVTQTATAGWAGRI